MNQPTFLASLFLSFFWSNHAISQCNQNQCTVPTPSVDAQEACILPNPAALNCYNGATFISTPVSFPPAWCTTIENNHSFAFIADSNTVTFRVCTDGCGPGGAIQAAVLSTNDCINFTFVSPCLGNIVSGTCEDLVASGLIVGEVYYLMIDGSAGALCDYTINGANPIATFDNGILLSTPASTYQWLLNGDSIPGATSQTFVPLVSGNYSVQVDCQAGWSISNVISVVLVGLSEATLGQLKIYPNPVSEHESKLTLELQGIDPQVFTLTLTDLAGREFLRRSVADLSEKTILETGDIPSGSYIVQVWQEGKMVATGMFLKI
ncbi:MAG: T9SS type A sorting domain-containing protein [Phycisphaerae bacterium]|nr:T9SS type A sorting domain-containing protein [Saprospiraceae bacterium]